MTDELHTFIDDEGSETPLDLEGFKRDIERLTLLMITDSQNSKGFSQVLEMKRETGSAAYTALVFQRAAAAFTTWITEDCNISLVGLATKNFTEFVRGYRFIRPDRPKSDE